MACILSFPSSSGCGVLVFTTQERDYQINLSPTLQESIRQLKGRWLIGLHHNWHDWHFKYNELYDFSMAGDGDLIEAEGVSFPRIPMDACNFVNSCFRSNNSEKFWDILYVARAVYFKRIPEFFLIIRRVFDLGIYPRTLLISPIPPFDKKQRKTVFYDIRKSYDQMFTEEEKNFFTLLTMDYRYPFPFDLPTLAHFYRSSKIFLHTADDERRCRVAAYAWSTGLPVVAMDCVSQILPDIVRKSPYYYKVDSYAQFPETVFHLLSSYNDIMKNWDYDLIDSYFSESIAPARLDKSLETIAKSRGLPYATQQIITPNLSLRLGRHHTSELSPNSVGMSVSQLVHLLDNVSFSPDDYTDSDDPEHMLSKQYCHHLHTFASNRDFFRLLPKLVSATINRVTSR